MVDHVAAPSTLVGLPMQKIRNQPVMTSEKPANPQLPQLPLEATADRMGANTAALAVFFGALLLFVNWDMLNSTIPALVFGADVNQSGKNIVATVFASLAMLVPMVSFELLVARTRRNDPTALGAQNAASTYRATMKTIGFYFTLLVIFLMYSVFPEYENDGYKLYWPLIRWITYAAILAAPVYIIYVDEKLDQPEDSLFHAGLFVSAFVRPTLFAKVNFSRVREHARIWLIKAFFTPLMFAALVSNVGGVLQLHLVDFQSSFLVFHQKAILLIFTVDVLFAFVGYIVTTQLLGTQIKSAEPTMLGWVVCVICYSPLNALVFGKYMNYDDKLYWDNWLTQLPGLQAAWGTVIIALLAVYSYATLAFGFRFSNLTYRGLITSGPYRFTKHPAYVAKNTAWWLMSVPFVAAADGPSALAMCAMLLMVNWIYWLRAKTEERHLANYPEYVAYAAWIEQHGIFRRVGTIIPLLRFNPQATSRLWWR